MCYIDICDNWSLAASASVGSVSPADGHMVKEQCPQEQHLHMVLSLSSGSLGLHSQVHGTESNITDKIITQKPNVWKKNLPGAQPHGLECWGSSQFSTRGNQSPEPGDLSYSHTCAPAMAATMLLDTVAAFWIPLGCKGGWDLGSDKFVIIPPAY